jgi:hypothetical protein
VRGGIAFETVEAREAYDPDRRLKLARLGELTPESAPESAQVWHTYLPVEMPSADAVIGALTHPDTWPDYATEIGPFTPLRAGGLLGQTFEIEVAAGTGSGLPVFTRGYVTVTDPRHAGRPGAARRLRPHDAPGPLHGQRPQPPAALPARGPRLGARGRHLGPMPWHVERAHSAAGKEAQHAFWGQATSWELSLQHQLARRLMG